jgi:maleylacetoacetate isomerase
MITPAADFIVIIWKKKLKIRKNRMTSHHDVVLYSYWRSSCSWRVRLALTLKSIDYEYVAVSLLDGSQSKPDYLEKNPSAKVPTLHIDGHYLTQSTAIIEYLEETRQNGQSLLPQDALQRAQVRQIVQLIAGDTQPLQNLAVLKKVAEITKGGEAEKKEWAQHWITRNFVALEKLLKESNGKYCVGDQVTLADICLVPQVYNAKRFDVDLSQFPTITKIEQHLSSLESFQKAHPDNQPDAQK